MDRPRKNSTARFITRCVLSYWNLHSSLWVVSAYAVLQALLSVFKGRVVDPTREKDTAVERCDVSVEDGEEKTKSRFIIKIMCRHGVSHPNTLLFSN